MLELRKPFNSINHDAFLANLKFFRVSGVCLNLFEYFSGKRRQYVLVNDVASNFLQLLRGVLQGSNLGLVLFSLYINDLPNACGFLTTFFVAGDRNLFCHIKQN